MIPPNVSCTRCGRDMRSGEWWEVQYEWSNGAVTIVALCPLHTDKEPAGDWHDDEE